MAFVEEPPRRTPVIAEAEVVVLGGGPAGIAAATAAAQAGVRTLLLERYGFLGGMGTAAMVTNFCGLHAIQDGEIVQVVHGVADDLLARIDGLDGLNVPHVVLGRAAAQSYDVSAYKCAADDLLMASGAAVRFHVLATGCTMTGNTIDTLLVETKSGRGAVRGECFIDCSGDADLAAWAGAPYEKGDAEGFLAYPTLMFRVGNVDPVRAAAEGKPNLRALMEAAEARGDFRFPRKGVIINAQKRPTEWRCNVTQIAAGNRAVDATNAEELSAAELEGRRQVRDFFRFLRQDVPGFEQAYLLEIAPQVGVRETRRIVGPYQVTGEDVVQARDFDDAIGVNPWPMERHVKGEIDWRFAAGRGYNQLPWRCVLPREVDNLLVAGRCASATSEGQSAIRVSGPCFVMGQAAGTAAALERRPGRLDAKVLQQRLAAAGVYFGA